MRAQLEQLQQSIEELRAVNTFQKVDKAEEAVGFAVVLIEALVESEERRREKYSRDAKLALAVFRAIIEQHGEDVTEVIEQLGLSGFVGVMEQRLLDDIKAGGTA